MRIDNRLIHGQVTVTWVSAINANHLMVVNDDVANDPIQKVLLPKAARGVKTTVLSVEDALAYVADAAHAEERIMILAKFPQDGLRLLQGGLNPEEVNVGNQAPRPGTKFTMVTKSIAVTNEDAVIYRAIADLGYPLQCRMLPTDRKENFINLLEKKKL